MKITNAVSLILIALFIGVVGFVLAQTEIVGFAIFIAFCIGFFLLYKIYQKPFVGIHLLIILGFFAIGTSRYINAPWGLTIDILLVIMYLIVFFKSFSIKIPWYKAKFSLTLLVTLWMAYVIVQLANPEALSIEAWFYAMRGVGLYQFLTIPLLFLFFNKRKDLHYFFIVWGLLSVLGTLKGLQQFYFGVDPFEQIWLNEGGAQTHVLFGKLRIFSFYSDAGQFGASQAHAGVVFIILTFFKRASTKLRLFYALVAISGFIGLVISGTRGALAVPVIGGLAFLILQKNIKLFFLGILLGAGVYFFFAHTYIGQSNAEIRRMRSAFNPNDASFQVRLANQRKLVGYLSTRPFGGGIGATGNWGKRFTPDSFLANTATDSWYVMIWSDTGIVGLIYYLFMIFYILITGARNAMFRIRDKDLSLEITAITAGMAGIVVASYGNGVFGQMPTGILMYISMVFMVISPYIDKKIENTIKE